MLIINFFKQLKSVDIKKSLSHRGGQLLLSIFRTALLIGLGYVILYPLLSMLSKAFSMDFMRSATVVWIPKKVGITNIELAIKYLKYWESISASARIGVVSAILQVLSCAMVGYGFARYKFPGRSVLFTIIILTIIVPPQTYIISMYMNYRFFNMFGISNLLALLMGTKPITYNLINTEWTFWLPSLFGVGLRSGLFIYIFRQFFAGMPRDLENAAKIDGCGYIKTYFKIMLPNALAPCLTVFLFSIVWHWNDYFMSSMLLQTKNIPVMVNLFRATDFQNEMVGYQGYMDMQFIYNACALLTLIPPLILYAFTQRFFMESVDRAGLKG